MTNKQIVYNLYAAFAFVALVLILTSCETVQTERSEPFDTSDTNVIECVPIQMGIDLDKRITALEQSCGRKDNAPSD